MTFSLQAAETAPEGIRRIILAEMGEIQTQLLAQPDGRDAAVHQSRKSFKRIRAALRLVRGVLPEAVYHAHNGFFRDQSRKLARARDAVVLLQTLDMVADAVDISQVRPFLEIEREQVNRELVASGVMVVIAAELAEWETAVADLPIPDADFAAFRDGLRKVYRRGRRRMAHAYAAPYDPHNFHDWRKRVKYLWHHCQILEPLWPDYFRMWGDGLHHLSDLLGDAHDLIVLRDHLQAASSELVAELAPLLAAIAARCAQLEAEAHLLGKRLYAEKPAAFVGRTAQYWAAWELAPELLVEPEAATSWSDPLRTTADLAVEYQCAPAQIRSLIAAGRLPAVKIGGQWIISTEDLPANLNEMIAK